jgi:hypothetical protein
MPISAEYKERGDDDRIRIGGHFLDFASLLPREEVVPKAIAELRRSRDELESIKRTIGKASHRRAQLRFQLSQAAAEAMALIRSAPELLPELPDPVKPEVRDRVHANYYDFDLPQRIPLEEDELVKQLRRLDVKRYGLAPEEVTRIENLLRDAIAAWDKEEAARAELGRRQAEARKRFDEAYQEAKRVLYPLLRAQGKEKLLAKVFYDYYPGEDPSVPPQGPLPKSV